MSFPTRERGLKCNLSDDAVSLVMSFPTRERGLKYRISCFFEYRRDVVPHAGTWIEIAIMSLKLMHGAVVPHAGTWIEILLIRTGLHVIQRRSPRGNVD